MEWLTGLESLTSEGTSGILVTLTSVRGHAPRAAGTKMVVSADRTWDTIGGGNLEATVTDSARRMLRDGEAEPRTEEMSLTEHTTTRYGRQCCGGKVEVLFEPIAAPPVVAIFGAGHVGTEIVRLLSRLPVTVHLADSRQVAVNAARALESADGPARLRVHHAPAPETVLKDLPPDSHVLIMSHDHAEDLILCDMALGRDDLASVGLIGSSAKWARFRKRLREQGHEDADIDRITCPIGISGIDGKSPALIAISVVAALAQDVAWP